MERISNLNRSGIVILTQMLVVAVLCYIAGNVHALRPGLLSADMTTGSLDHALSILQVLLYALAVTRGLALLERSLRHTKEAAKQLGLTA